MVSTDQLEQADHSELEKANHSEFALEMVLSKGFGASDFSEKKSDGSITDAIKLVKNTWDDFHGQDYKITTARANEPGTNQLPDTKRVLIGELTGSRSFYAKAEYLPPNLAGGKAQIRVTVPLRSGVEGLESVDAVELNSIRDALSSVGYKPIK